MVTVVSMAEDAGYELQRTETGYRVVVNGVWCKGCCIPTVGGVSQADGCR
ncbi:hypothetical protein FDG2_1566 [Candidatus Protofrankia californiensis]|uniref:Uncharacterized protein n=1 Tax=Candidatus Protofrankia californiensis TaxID=1839754 RepID=A0A1C3NVY6_9ACTN|nr:hypothetical protein FDG2_1566 [Candidatus Protofrankia californiensis]